jgi:hypothetical protein
VLERNHMKTVLEQPVIDDAGLEGYRNGTGFETEL